MTRYPRSGLYHIVGRSCVSKACFYVMRIILYPRRGGVKHDNRQVLNEGEARMQRMYIHNIKNTTRIAG